MEHSVKPMETYLNSLHILFFVRLLIKAFSLHFIYNLRDSDAFPSYHGLGVDWACFSAGLSVITVQQRNMPFLKLLQAHTVSQAVHLRVFWLPILFE